MKLSTRKRIIKGIAIFFVLWGICTLIDYLEYFSFHRNSGSEIRQYFTSNPEAYLLPLFVLASWAAAISLWFFQRRIRIETIILTFISYGYLFWLFMGKIGGYSPILSRLLHFHFTLFLNVIGMLFCVYVILFMLHKDTKLIFEHKGKIEGTEESK